MPAVVFTLKNYLAKLHQEEAVIPTGRVIPTNKELAEKCGMGAVSFSRMVNNGRDAIPREVLAVLITEFRERGFMIDFDDLFRYVDN